MKLDVSGNYLLVVYDAEGDRVPVITRRFYVVETHRLRAGHDAVMVGAETAIVDDPLLTVRHGEAPRVAPTRIVLDGRARLRPDHRLLRTIDQAPLTVYTAEGAPNAYLDALTDAGARVVPVAASREGDGTVRLALEAVLADCHAQGLFSVFCEGGASLAGALIGGGFVDRLYLFTAPAVLGRGGVGVFPVTVACTISDLPWFAVNRSDTRLIASIW